LGTVVARAHKDSGLTVDAWNALTETDREHRLVDAIAMMRIEAATRQTEEKVAAAVTQYTAKMAQEIERARRKPGAT
jgi:predicted metal-dependent hydrolase